ncbi:reverse transcriptase domain-containing protein [Tanacetum coccineum]
MFPVQSRMAMDILSVQATSVASESAFSTSGRVLSIQRIRLTSTSLEMCMCLKDHLDAQERKQDKPTLETPVDYEEEILDAEEKSHFMVKEGIVLGHKISKNGIEVDKAKVNVIAKLPHPTTVKDTSFFSKEYIEAFQNLKKKLTEAPILISPDWDLPFELMCDASDYAIGAVLGQRKEKHFRPVHYSRKTMTEAQAHYTTTEKEMLAVVYAFEKFRSYLVLSKSIVYTNHSALKYLFSKQDAKPRLLW